MVGTQLKRKFKIYNNTARKIPYKRIFIKIKIIKLFKKPLFIVYKGKEKTDYQLIQKTKPMQKVKSTKESGKVEAYKTRGSQQQSLKPLKELQDDT